MKRWICSPKYHDYLDAKNKNMQGYQDIRFNSIIDNHKYKSGAEYKIDFNLNTKDFSLKPTKAVEIKEMWNYSRNQSVKQISQER